MKDVEHRAGVEFRISGRTLSGTVLRYGDLSPSFGERFLPGSFGPTIPAVPLNLQHDAKMQILAAGDFILSDSPRSLEIRAELHEGSAALRLVKAGALNGYSIEFHAKEEHREAGVRVIERAELVGIGLVDSPAYPASTAEVRRRRRSGGTWKQSAIQAEGSPKNCKCIGDKSKCRKVVFTRDAFEKAIRDAEAGKHNIIATTKDFSPENILGDTRSGALRLSLVERDIPIYRPRPAPDGVIDADFDEIDEPPIRTILTPGSMLISFLQGILGGLAGEGLAKALGLAEIVVRPVIDEKESEFSDDEETGVRTYQRAHVTALLVKYADPSASPGWLSLFDPVADEEEEATDNLVVYPWL